MTPAHTVAPSWATFERFLERYQLQYSFLRLIKLAERPGVYVLIIAPLLFLGMAYIVCLYASGPRWPRYICACFTAYMIVDYLLVNTSIAFVTRSPRNPLRSVILTVAVFANLALGYSVWYVLEASSFEPHALTLVPAIYFSFVTIATVGYGDITPKSTLAQLTVVSEIMVGLYFLAVVLAVVTGWAPAAIAPPKGKE